MNKTEKISLAVLLTIISAFAYSALIALTKIVGQGISSNMIVVFRYGVTFFLFVPYLFFYKKESTQTALPMKHFIRSVFGFLGLVTTIIATRYISVPNAVLLSNTYPLFLPLLILIFEKKHLSKFMATGILIGFLGVAYILKPNSQIISGYAFLALSSGLFTALTMTYVRELAKTETISQINFQFLCYSFLFAIFFSLLDFQIPTTSQLLGLLGIGLIGTLYQQTFLFALKFAHSIIVAPIFYLSIVFGALIEWYFDGVTPTLKTMIGCLLVFIGATITVIVGGQAKHLTRR
jgi:drug/metabolite transporter (DMT)-like permease